MKGVSEMVALLKQIGQKFPDRVSAALYQEAQVIMTESKRRCPVAKDGGVLRASGAVSQPVRGAGRNISVTLSYGGAADAYALAVHEHLSVHSPPSWLTAEENGHPVQWTSSGTGPKFLESVINEAKPEMAGRLMARIDLNKANT
jgi:hypothetical protein